MHRDAGAGPGEIVGKDEEKIGTVFRRQRVKNHQEKRNEEFFHRGKGVVREAWD